MSASERNETHTCILVIGMHRSGTSLAANVLKQMGISFGTKLIPPAKDNPKGFFEDSDIVQMNKELFAGLGIDVNGLESGLPATWQSSPVMSFFKKELKKILEEKKNESIVFGIKDPRISLLLPMYKSVLNELHIKTVLVWAQRDPVEVAISIHERNGIPISNVVERIAEYNRIIAIDFDTKKDIVVDYDALVNDPETHITALSKELHSAGIATNALSIKEISEVVDVSLRHHDKSSAEFTLGLMKENEGLQKKLQEKDNLSEEIKVFHYKTVELLDSAKKNFEEEGIRNEKQLQKFEQEISELRAQASNYEKQEKNNARQIEHQASVLNDKNAEVNNLHIELTNIERSFTWKAVKAWDIILYKLVGENTWIAICYRNILEKMQNFINGFLADKTFRIVKKHIALKTDAEDFWKKFYDAHPETEVLFVSHDMSRTGAPRIVFDVAEGFKKDHKIAMACLDRGAMEGEFRDAFGTIIIPKDIYPADSQEEQVSLILDKVKPKVVYVNSQSAFQFARVAKQKGIPVIFHIHELEIAMKFFFSDKQLKTFNTYADLYIAVSQPVYDFLVHKLGCNPASVLLQHAFVDSKKVQEASEVIDKSFIQQELEIVPEEGEVIIMTVGMFIYRKGADIFMRVAKKIIDKGYKCKFIWIGSKPFKEPFMENFSKYKDYFILVGEKKNPFPYLKIADIFALPSREDPFPLVTLEAMSLGIPAVIFKESGGIHKAVGTSGIQVSEFNEDEFEEALIALITDAQRREKLGNRAIEAQKPYDSSVSLPTIYSHISSLLKKVQ